MPKLNRVSVVIGVVSGIIAIYQFLLDGDNSTNIQTNITTYSTSNSIGQNAVSNNTNTNTITINSK